jgi:transcriptional regulator with XRE-family HTH domain
VSFIERQTGREITGHSGSSDSCSEGRGYALAGVSKVPCTIKDVARLAGVSIATVSRVTSGSNAVSGETAARVLEAFSQLEYRPNVLAAELARAKRGFRKVRGSHQPASDAVNQPRASYSGAIAQDKHRRTA